MKMRSYTLFLAILVIATLTVPANAGKLVSSFSQDLGRVTIGTVREAQTYDMPAILWGGEYMWFSGNGNNVITQRGSTLNKFGVSIKLIPGDDFYGQVRNYMSGKTPFLRGTYRMIAMASEAVGNDSRTKPIILFQMTWSRGDHCIARKHIKQLSQLKGATVCLQKGGPHVGMLDDMLKTAGLTWSDIKVVWVDDISGPKGPAVKFAKDRSIDACFVVTPDMFGLLGDPENPGAEGTVADAHRLISTSELGRSIADVVAVRSDFYQSHSAWCEKLTVAYLQEAEKMVQLRKNPRDRNYRATLQTAINFFGKDVVPNMDEAHGLFLDCQPVGHPGNVVFFTEENNVTGFDAFNAKSLDMATTLGYATRRIDLLPSALDWNSPTFKNNLRNTSVVQTARFKPEAVADEIEALAAGGQLDEKTKYSFCTYFEPNQRTFDRSKYGRDFDEVIKLASQYSGATVAVRGHTDPTKTLLHLINAGMAKEMIKRSGSRGNWSYSLNGRPLNLTATKEMVRLVESGQFDGHAQWDPREVMTVALRLSADRAEAFRDELLAYAKSKGIRLDASQITVQGVGIREPFNAKPRNKQEAAANMRVECALVSVSAEAMQPADFDF